MNVSIRREREADFRAIRRLHRLAFGQDLEGRLVDALRDGGYARLSLVAHVPGELVGHVLFSGITIVEGSHSIPALALAPVAVHPDRQRCGIGSQLISRGLEICQRQGHRIVLVVGEPAYYARFGFSSELARSLRTPYAGDAFMALEITNGALQGVRGEVQYSPPFHDL